MLKQAKTLNIYSPILTLPQDRTKNEYTAIVYALGQPRAWTTQNAYFVCTRMN